MTGFKILLFMLFVIFYVYNIRMWFMGSNVKEEKTLNLHVNGGSIPEIKPNKSQLNVMKPKKIPLFVKDACSALEVFTQKPHNEKTKRSKFKTMHVVNNTIEVLGISIFLAILVLNAFLDVLKVKEEERIRRELNPDGEIRQSLAEFANKKMLRRESSKFNLQLHQIVENVVNSSEENKSPRETRSYRRADSINSYLGEKTLTKTSTSASIEKTPVERKMVKQHSVAKLIGARPTPMVRRSSYPALPLNPEIQALMMNSRQSSIDSDDESEKKHRRVRILRRF